jgi:hypothetical protein
MQFWSFIKACTCPIMPNQSLFLLPYNVLIRNNDFNKLYLQLVIYVQISKNVHMDSVGYAQSPKIIQNVNKSKWMFYFIHVSLIEIPIIMA